MKNDEFDVDVSPGFSQLMDDPPDGLPAGLDLAVQAFFYHNEQAAGLRLRFVADPKFTILVIHEVETEGLPIPTLVSVEKLINREPRIALLTYDEAMGMPNLRAIILDQSAGTTQ